LVNSSAAKKSKEQSHEFSGQMISCAFYFGKLQLHSDHIRGKQYLSEEASDSGPQEVDTGFGMNSDQQKGAFEVDGMSLFDLDDLEKFVKQVHTSMPGMDQHGFLSCVYASMCVHGARKTKQEFAKRLDTSAIEQGIVFEGGRFKCKQPATNKYDSQVTNSWWDPQVPDDSDTSVWSKQTCSITGLYKGRTTVHPSVLINPYYKGIFETIVE